MKLYLIILCIFLPTVLHAQAWSWEVGSNKTDYSFTNSLGTQVDYIRPASGLHVQISRDQAFYTRKKSISIDSIRIKKGFWSIFKYRIDLGYNQFNSFGGTKGVIFNYQTDFASIGLGVGPDIPLFVGMSLGLRGTLSANQILSGNQQIGATFFDLAQNKDFSKIRLFAGYSIRLAKEVSPNIRLFAHYQYFRNQIEAGSTASKQLLMHPTTISLGITLIN